MLERLRKRISPHRRRIARLLVIALLLAVGAEIAPNVPRQADLEFALGPDHGDIVQVQVGYVQDGDVFHSVRFEYPAGAPAVIEHSPSLPSGDYEVRVALREQGGRRRTVLRSLRSPVDGRMRLLLGAGQ